MNIVRRHRFGKIEGLELGFAPIGSPLMNVFVYRLDTILIDSGQSNMRRTILDFVMERPPEAMFLTHHHEDHSGNAAAIEKRFGCVVYGHPGTVEKMTRKRPIRPYQHYVWGRSQPVNMQETTTDIEIGGSRLTPVFTPGHSPDHTVWLLRETGVLFAGDLYLADRIKYFRIDENIAEMIDSIRRVMKEDFEMLLCAHRPQLKDGKTRMAAKLAFLEDFHGQVGVLLDKGIEPKEMIRQMGLHEDKMTKCVTLGNVSLLNMVHSSIRGHKRDAVIL